MTFNSRAIACVYSRMVSMTFWRKRVRRQNHRGVAGMNAGKFDVLQHPADDDGAFVGIFELADIGDAIHVHFGRVFEKFVHQHRPFRRGFDGEAHVVRQLRRRNKQSASRVRRARSSDAPAPDSPAAWRRRALRLRWSRGRWAAAEFSACRASPRRVCGLRRSRCSAARCR